MIDFIAAEDGHIILRNTKEGHTYRAQYPWGVEQALVIEDGLSPEAMHSSTLDFAAEYGFKAHGDAWQLLRDGLQRFNTI